MHIKRKYSIFISSSFKDLREARTEIVKEVLKINHIPVGMELFRAGNEQNLSVIEKEINNCDIFILLVGARLGSKISLENQSTFTEWEYAKAYELGKPIFVFLLKNDEYIEARNAIPVDDPERKCDQALSDFRDVVQKTENGKKIVEFFSYEDTADLRAKIANVINFEVQNLNSGGWVPGSVYDELQQRVVFNEIASKNPFFIRFSKHFNDYTKLSKKTVDQNQLKTVIGKYIWDIFLHRIILEDVTSLYFDSGSSIAYLTEQFIHILDSSPWTSDLQEKLRIHTSNLLTFLDFTLMDPKLHSSVNINLLPKAPVESSYGSTFGDFTRAIKFPAPRNWCAFHQKVRPFIDDMKQELVNSLGKKSIIFLAASGLETRPDIIFRGPHVGSYYNQLVKRSLLETRLPIVLVLDETKFQKDFIVGKCYPVCGPDLEWDDVIKTIPFAIALAASTKHQLDSIVHQLSLWGLDSPEPLIEQDGIWPIVATNKLFKDFLWSEVV